MTADEARALSGEMVCWLEGRGIDAAEAIPLLLTVLCAAMLDVAGRDMHAEFVQWVELVPQASPVLH